MSQKMSRWVRLAYATAIVLLCSAVGMFLGALMKVAGVFPVLLFIAFVWFFYKRIGEWEDEL